MLSRSTFGRSSELRREIMDMDHLRCFAYIAEYRSFTKAAEMLHIAQPAISRKIKSLEAECGYRLFVRSTNSISLTPQGARLLKRAKDVLRQFDALMEEVAAIRSVDGELRVGCFGAAYEEQMLKGAVGSFQLERPHARVELHRREVSELTDGLYAGEIDLLLGISAYLPMDGVVRHKPIGRLPLQAILPVGHPFEKRDEVRLSELVGETVLIPRRASGPLGIDMLMEYLRERGFSESQFRYVDSFRSICPSVSFGWGVSFATAGTVSEREDGVVCVDVAEASEALLAATAVDFMWLASSDNPLIEAFVDSAQQCSAVSSMFTSGRLVS